MKNASKNVLPKTNYSKFVALETKDFTILKFAPEDYSLLEFNDLNRDINDRHVEKLKKLIDENGLLRFPIVVEGNGVFSYMDGQHLAKALMKNNQTIYCFLCKGDYIKNMFDLNNSANKYSVKYCIRALSRAGDKNYITLWEKTNKEEIKKVLKPGIIAALYACSKGKQAINQKDAAKMIVDRRYKISKNIAYCDNVVKQIKDCRDAGVSDVYDYNSSLIDLIVELGSEYKHNEFVKKISKFKDFKNKVYKNTIREAKLQLKEIYHDKKPGYYNGIAEK